MTTTSLRIHYARVSNTFPGILHFSQQHACCKITTLSLDTEVLTQTSMQNKETPQQSRQILEIAAKAISPSRLKGQ